MFSHDYNFFLKKRNELKSLLDGRGNSLYDSSTFELLNNLISEKSIEYKKIISKFTSIKCDIFNNKIFPLVPLYITSYCYKDCKYCNFRKENDNVLRKRLTINKLIAVKEFLIKKGFNLPTYDFNVDSFIDKFNDDKLEPKFNLNFRNLIESYKTV